MAASMLADSAARSVAWAPLDPFVAPVALSFDLAVPLPLALAPGLRAVLDAAAEPWLSWFIGVGTHGCSTSIRLTAHSRKRRLPSRRSALQIENGSFCRTPSSISLSRTIGGRYMTRSSLSEYIT